MVLVLRRKRRDESGEYVSESEDVQALSVPVPMVQSIVIEERRRFRDAELVGHAGSWDWDVVRGVISWSDGLFALHGLDPTAIDGGYDEAASRVHEDDRQLVDDVMAACRLDDTVRQIRYRIYRASDGEIRWFNSRAQGVFNEGRLVRLIGAVADVTERVLAEEILLHGALHDVLTGLPNRALLMDRLEAALKRSVREKRDVGVLYCDLDGFQEVNNSAGHAAGDAILVETADRLIGTVREGDTVARLGGDEFVVIVEPWNREMRTNLATGAVLSVEVANRILRSVSRPFEMNGVSHEVSISVGVAVSSADATGTYAQRATKLMDAANQAMYDAKNAGKNRLERFSET